MNKDIKINHLAIIMDGNRRWAKREGLSDNEGHKQGVENAKQILSNVLELGIPYLTLFTFSTENWKRSEKEVSYIFNLLSSYLKSQKSDLQKNGVKLKFIGQLGNLSLKLQDSINKITEATKDNNKITLYIALSYGSMQEITDACQKIINSGIKSITTEQFKDYLYDPGMPSVDLLIRPGGVCRISNFLLWQIAYAELYFSKKYWPEFSKEDLVEAVNDYSKRKRNFGL